MFFTGSPENFLEIRSELLKLGFKEKTLTQFRNDFARLDFHPSSNREYDGREVGFYYSLPHGWSVFIWTSYLSHLKRFRKNDAGRALILDRDRILYSVKINRGRNFVRNLIVNAWILQVRVNERPICCACEKYMNIATKKTGAHYFVCVNPAKHEKSVSKDWDFNFKGVDGGKHRPKALEFMELRRTLRVLSRKNNRKKGYDVGGKRFQPRWEIRKLENRLN